MKCISKDSNNGASLCDVGNKLYNQTVRDHFHNPRNFLEDETEYEADAIGVVGNCNCGDVLAVWIKVNPKTNQISECKWRTFGCASSIASTSIMSVMITEDGGMKLSKAKHITPELIIDRLGGLPDVKYKCSVMCHRALREAILDYEENKK